MKFHYLPLVRPATDLVGGVDIVEFTLTVARFWMVFAGFEVTIGDAVGTGAVGIVGVGRRNFCIFFACSCLSTNRVISKALANS